MLPSRQFRLHFPFKIKVRGCRNNRSLNSIVKNIEYDSKYHYSICLPLIPSQKNASLNWEINLYFVWIPCLLHHIKPKTPITTCKLVLVGLLRTRRYLLSPLRHCERSSAPTHVETLGTRSVSAIMRRVEPEDLERTRCEGLFSSRETADCLPVFFFLFLLLSPLLIMEQPRPAMSCTMQSTHARTHKQTCKHIQKNIRCTAQMQMQVPLKGTSLN